MAGRTSVDAERALARIDGTGPISGLVQLIGDRVVAAVREYDATLIEEVFSDGLLNVMEAPEFVRSDKLRRVFAALENRAYLGQLFDSIAGTGRVQAFIGAGEWTGRDARRLAGSRLVRRARPSGRRRRRPGPTRMAYPQAIGTVRFVSRPDE